MSNLLFLLANRYGNSIVRLLPYDIAKLIIRKYCLSCSRCNDLSVIKCSMCEKYVECPKCVHKYFRKDILLKNSVSQIQCCDCGANLCINCGTLWNNFRYQCYRCDDRERDGDYL